MKGELTHSMVLFNYDKIIENKFEINAQGQSLYHDGRKVYTVPDEATKTKIKLSLKQEYRALSIIGLLTMLLGWKIGLALLLSMGLYFPIRNGTQLRRLLPQPQKLSWGQAQNFSVQIQARAYNKIVLWGLLALSVFLTGVMLALFINHPIKGNFLILILFLLFARASFLFIKMIRLKYAPISLGPDQQSGTPKGIEPT